MNLRSSRAAQKRFLWLAAGAVALTGVIGAGWVLLPTLRTQLYRMPRLLAWFDEPEMHTNWQVKAGERCGDAPFLMPTDGYIGFLWGDSFRPFHRHQGLDIFGGGAVGITPVTAAYSGYLTRQADWKSSVIVRAPQDPLQPERQIWLYYTHMADAQGNSFIDEDFPPGTTEKYIEAGTLLGYQGNFSGDPNSPTGIHLHFSIVEDDGQGEFRNELKIENTIDPSPYFGMMLSTAVNPTDLAVCESEIGR